MATIDLDITFCGKEPGSIGEAVVRKVFSAPDLGALGLNLREDVVVKEKMYHVSMQEGITRKREGCGTPDVGGISFREKFLEPVNLEISMHFCAEDFAGTVAELARKKGYDVNNLEGTQLQTIIEELVTPIWRRDMLTIAEFGDTASADPMLSAMDGMWKQIFAGVALTGSDPDKITRAVTVPAGALAADYAINTFLPGLYFGQPELMKDVDDAQKVFVVSGSIYENYMQSLIANRALESSWTDLQNGVRTVTYMGIPVVQDRLIDQKAATLKHRGYLTVKDGFQLATDTMQDSQVMTFWYDKTTDKNYIRVRYKLAVNYVDGDVIVVGY